MSEAADILYVHNMGGARPYDRLNAALKVEAARRGQRLEDPILYGDPRGDGSLVVVRTLGREAAILQASLANLSDTGTIVTNSRGLRSLAECGSGSLNPGGQRKIRAYAPAFKGLDQRTNLIAGLQPATDEEEEAAQEDGGAHGVLRIPTGKDSHMSIVISHDAWQEGLVSADPLYEAIVTLDQFGDAIVYQPEADTWLGPQEDEYAVLRHTSSAIVETVPSTGHVLLGKFPALIADAALSGVQIGPLVSAGLRVNT
ncbi:MAG TPA: hypothetical protein VGS28_03825 [Candidatus Saccharimonadales bacterium]|nr:hypothetical protein [Candidatus Saccharimonadales bacterium]